jgi:predicted membrane protein
MSGNVQLQLPANTSANLHASSFSGDLRSDFGTAKKPEHGPGSSLDARLGDGAGKINIETFSGDLRVRKQG